MAHANSYATPRMLAFGLCILVGGSCSGKSSASADGKAAVTREAAPVTVLSRKTALANYPCQECHQHAGGEADSAVKSHREIQVVHMDGGENCQTCHDKENPEQLRLATGKQYGLDDVHELCRQCHGSIVADWEVGVHGKNVGNWLTGIQRFGCTACHNPHKPKYQPTKMLPPPPFSRFGIPKGAH